MLDRFDRELGRSLTGDHDEFGRDLALANRLEERDAVELGHLEVGENDAELLGRQAIERLLAVLGDLDSIALIAEDCAETRSDRLLVVGDENLRVCVLHALSWVR